MIINREYNPNYNYNQQREIFSTHVQQNVFESRLKIQRKKHQPLELPPTPKNLTN